ncbi:MAG: nicotinate-nucleotide pyrophosphorylase (carboxylating) [Mariniblastus sp.]
MTSFPFSYLNLGTRLRTEYFECPLTESYPMKSSPEFNDATQIDCLKLIEMALLEDLGAVDIDAGVDCTTDAIVPKSAQARAAFVSRDEGVVCGVEIAKLALAKWAPGIKLEVECQDGQTVRRQQTIAVMSGSARDILTMERTCLNFMCRLSGISSLTQKYVQEIAGTSACVLDTRKTTPGWRRLEKYAVACGGGKNHRMGLYDAIMLKDNHLAFYRSLVEDNDATIPTSIGIARQWINDHQARLPNGVKTILQLEVDTLEQLEIALGTDCDIILLDNMGCEKLSQAVAMRNDQAPSILLEASGGVTLTTIGKIAQTGVERISVGALTHSALNFDIGLDWKIAI